MDIAIETGTDAADRTVLRVAGAIDVQNRDQLLESGRDAVREGATALVLDLAGVTFLDSTGIGALVELGHDCEDAGDAGIAFVIRHPSGRVLRVLEMTGLIDAWSLERQDA